MKISIESSETKFSTKTSINGEAVKPNRYIFHNPLGPLWLNAGFAPTGEATLACPPVSVVLDLGGLSPI